MGLEGGVLGLSISRRRRPRGLGAVVKDVYQEGDFV